MIRKAQASRHLTLFRNANALTIAGSDPSGGAGLQADLKTFQRIGAYGTSVVTLLTVQNTLGVRAIEVLSPDFVVAQIDAVVSDIPPGAAKTGALGNVDVIQAVAERAKDFSFPLIVDPVMVSKHGDTLLPADAVEVIAKKLLPMAYLVTPNRFEAEKLCGQQIDPYDSNSVAEAIRIMHEFGARNVLLKLGEIDGVSVNILGLGTENIAFKLPRLKKRNTHGTGCVLSAAIVGGLAIGQDLRWSVDHAIRAVHYGIETGQAVGSGEHPIEFNAIPFGLDDQSE
jgi:hydroxymethylpyrimidine/phosphomethylpyrimidine kinase